MTGASISPSTRLVASISSDCASIAALLSVLMMITSSPPARMWSLRPRTTAEKNGFEISGMTAPIMCARPADMARASALG